MREIKWLGAATDKIKGGGKNQGVKSNKRTQEAREHNTK